MDKYIEYNITYANMRQIVKNYFKDNYNEPIFDGDLECIDMIYYSKDLRKKDN